MRRLPSLVALVGALLPAAPLHAQAYRDTYAAGAALVAAGRADEAYPLFADVAQAAELRRDTAVSVRARRVLAQMDHNRGARLLGLNRPAEALVAFERGTANDPVNARNAYGLAQALQRLGREDDAIAAYQRGIAAAQQRGSLDLARAGETGLRALLLGPLRPVLSRQALPAAAAATALLPRFTLVERLGLSDADTDVLRGRALVAGGRHVDALALANAALLRPGVTPLQTSWLQLVRAEALVGLRRFPEARSAYRAVRVGPPAEWAAEALR